MSKFQGYRSFRCSSWQRIWIIYLTMDGPLHTEELETLKLQILSLEKNLTDMEKRTSVIELAANTMAQGLLVFDSTEILYSNFRVAELLGVPFHIMKAGQSWHNFQKYLCERGEYGDAATPDKIIKKMEGKIIEATRYSIERHFSNGAHIRVDSEPLPSGGIIATYTDISEQTLQLEKLKVARKAAEASAKAKSEFLANMSHEIRTPMNGVIGMAELLLETDLQEDQLLYANTIANSGAALLSIINDILNYSKIVAGNFKLENEIFDLQTTVEEIATLLATKATEKSIEIFLRYDPTIPSYFLGDVGRIRQIITNIVGNAVKFTLEGFVYVDVSSRTCDGKNYVQVLVKDTGIGIPQNDIGQIFKKFKQVDGASNRKFEGTGLGLAISAKLIELMGGEISTVSKINEGSTFSISLPLEMSCKILDDSNCENLNIENLVVLVVCGFEANRLIISERFESWGCTTVLASSGLEALGNLSNTSKEIDFVIQDFQLPDMDGVDLALRIRQLPHRTDLPIIMLSRSDKNLGNDVLENVGKCEVQPKPFRVHSLKTSVARLLGHEIDPSLAKKTCKSEHLKLLNKKILIVEDNKTNQVVVKNILKNTEAKLNFANNGKEAIVEFEKETPDFIFMDMSMPVMDGVEATKNIRSLERNTPGLRTPIIALTANAFDKDKERCEDAGMDGFLTKPIKKASLLAELKCLVDDEDKAAVKP